MHPQPIRAVIFDIGGTVHPTDHCEQAMLRAFHVAPATYRRHAMPLIKKFHLGRITEKQYFVALAKTLQRQVPENWHTLWRAQFRPYARMFPEIRELLKQLKIQHVMLAALSDTIPPHAGINRQRGMYAPFRKTFLSYKLGMHKPKKNFYRYALYKIRVPAQQCIYVDDNSALLVPARELGMHVILARNPRQTAKDVRKLVRR